MTRTSYKLTFLFQFNPCSTKDMREGPFDNRWRPWIYNNKVGIRKIFRTVLGDLGTGEFLVSVCCIILLDLCPCIVSSTMFRGKNEGNVVYKCTVQLLEDSDVLECEFQVRRLKINEIDVHIPWWPRIRSLGSWLMIYGHENGFEPPPLIDNPNHVYRPIRWTSN